MNKIRKYFRLIKKRPEIIYLIISSLAIIGFISITPPAHGPDETFHYEKIQLLANGYLLPNTDNNSNLLPNSILNSISTVKTGMVEFYQAKKYDIQNLINSFQFKYSSEVKYKPYMVSYTPIPYLPAVPAVWIANKLDVNPIISLYLSRISIAIVTILIIAYSIRIFPYNKYLLTFGCLLPMFLFITSMINADNISNAVTLLFIVYVLYLYYLKKITNLHWFTLFILSLFLFLAKPVSYLAFLLVIILFKRNNFKKWIPIIALICISVISIWTAVNSKLNNFFDPDVANNINKVEQIKNIIMNPMDLFSVFQVTYFNNTPGDFIAHSFIGVFGTIDAPLPLFYCFLYFIMLGILLVTDLSDGKIKKLPNKIRYFGLFLALLFFVVINLTLYIGASPVGYSSIYGMQGRYLIVVLLILSTLFFVKGIKVSKKDKNKIINSLIIISTLVLAISLFIEYQRYYITYVN